MSDKKINIRIPLDLYSEIKRKIELEDKFNNVEDFVEFVLRELFKENISEQIFDSEDENKVKERLKSLGYL